MGRTVPLVLLFVGSLAFPIAPLCLAFIAPLLGGVLYSIPILIAELTPVQGLKRVLRPQPIAVARLIRR